MTPSRMPLSRIIERDTDTVAMQDDALVFASRNAAGSEPENPEAPQLVIGTTGSSALAAGRQDDTVVAAQGHQVMSGLTGNDQFVVPMQGRQRHDRLAAQRLPLLLG
jgi:peroxidase